MYKKINVFLSEVVLIFLYLAERDASNHIEDCVEGVTNSFILTRSHDLLKGAFQSNDPTINYHFVL